mgnify:CR=1 FL=1
MGCPEDNLQEFRVARLTKALGDCFQLGRGSLSGLARTLPGVGSEVGETKPEEDARLWNSDSEARLWNSGSEASYRFVSVPGDRFPRRRRQW